MKRIAWAVFALLLCGISSALAVPNVLNYQGQLFLNGTPTAGAVSITFRMFTAPTGGTELWSETDVVTVTAGLFSTILGDGTTFPPTLFTAQVPWLEMEASGQVLSPRTQFQSVPYALNAPSAGGDELWQFDGTNVWRSSGRVGVGTATPELELDVSGVSRATEFWTRSQPLGNGSAYATLLPDRLRFNGSYGYGPADQWIEFQSGFSPSIGGQGPMAKMIAYRSPEGYDLGEGRLRLQVRQGSSMTDALLVEAGGIRTSYQGLGNGSSAAYLQSNNLTFDGTYGYGPGDQFVRFNSEFHDQWGPSNNLLAQITGWRLPEDYDLGRGRIRFSVRNGGSTVDPLALDPSGVVVTGNFTATGTKCREVDTPEYGKLYFNATEDAQALFTVGGESRLRDGRAVITLDPKWLAGVSIDDANPMRVWISFIDDPGGWHHVEKGTVTFTVVGPNGSSARFDWKVEARQKGYEALYLNQLEPTAAKN